MQRNAVVVKFIVASGMLFLNLLIYFLLKGQQSSSKPFDVVDRLAAAQLQFIDSILLEIIKIITSSTSLNDCRLKQGATTTIENFFAQGNGHCRVE